MELVEHDYQILHVLAVGGAVTPSTNCDRLFAAGLVDTDAEGRVDITEAGIAAIQERARKMQRQFHDDVRSGRYATGEMFETIESPPPGTVEQQLVRQRLAAWFQKHFPPAEK